MLINPVVDVTNREARPARCVVVACLLLFSLAATGCATADDVGGGAGPDIPTGKLLYHGPLSTSDSIEGWVMEGPAEITFTDQWMQMQTPSEGDSHTTFWCPKDFPESFYATWQWQNLSPPDGLAIVFFAARGEDGQDIFDPSLPPRDGAFIHYIRGSIVSYHISYYAGMRRFSHLRKNNTFAMAQRGMAPLDGESTRVHQLHLLKDGPHIRMWIDDRKIISWTDDGIRFGPVWGSGKFGLRQMAGTNISYRDLRVYEVPPGTGQLFDDFEPEGPQYRFGQRLTDWFGPWVFKADPEDRGQSEGWYKPQYDDSDWMSILVPGFWEETAVGDYLGYGWYRTTIDVPESWQGKPLYLRFEGVDEQAWVYVNGKQVGEHSIESEGLGVADLWNRPFNVRIEPEDLLPGQLNLLSVRVHASRGNAGIWQVVNIFDNLEQID